MVAFIILVYAAYQLGLLDNVLKRFSVQEERGGVTEDVRFEIWRMGLMAFKQWPFGYGPGTYRYAIAEFGGHHDAHNTYFWLLINNGIFIILLASIYLFI